MSKNSSSRHKERRTLSEVFFLRSPNEIYLPYERKLSAMCEQIRWFSNLKDLVDQTQTVTPQIVVVDLDALTPPHSATFEKLQNYLPQTDKIALSSQDSAQLALTCVRSGFADFLLKPISPQELLWSMEKCQQKKDLSRQFSDTQTQLLKGIAQVSSSSSPAITRALTTEQVALLLNAAGCAWLEPTQKEEYPFRIVAQSTKKISDQEIQRMAKVFVAEKNAVKIRKSVVDNLRKIWMPFPGESGAFLMAWGISGPVDKTPLAHARRLLEHCEISLLNFRRMEEIKKQTFIDDLTGLYNSRYLKYAITNSILRFKKTKLGFSILFIDVDHFKSVNDKHGHLVGSDFLVAISRTVKNAVRNMDPVFRYGGDEFVVILNETTVEGAREIAERIRKNIERRVFVIQGQKLQTTVSIGLASFPEHAVERDSLLRLADEAMYSAKKHSRNAVHLAYGLDKGQS